jgi:hypothetical protein
MILGCGSPTKEYEFELGITAGEFAPDSLLVNGRSVEMTRTEEVKTQRLDFIEHWYESVRSDTQNVTIEWKEGKETFQARLLLNPKPKPGAGMVYIWTEKWQKGHDHLPGKKNFIFMHLQGGIQLESLTRNGVPIPKERAALVRD